MFDFTFIVRRTRHAHGRSDRGHRLEVRVLRTHNDMNVPVHKVQGSLVRVTIVGLSVMAMILCT